MKVGDRVVCVRTHSLRAVIKGKIYEIFNIYKSPCCGKIIYDVGISGHGKTRCLCGKILGGAEWWIGSWLFRPIEYNSATEELANKEIVKETLDVPIKEPLKVN